MSRCISALLTILLWTAAAFAQVVPGRYVVELEGPPLGVAARIQSKDALKQQEVRILTEQSRVKGLVEQHRGTVVSAVENVMNALLVRIPEENVIELDGLPG